MGRVVVVTPYWHDDWLTVYQGDCRAVLATLPAESVHCVVTSPPYWGLRDYGVSDQLGLEPTPEAYVANMVAVFREVRRVLRKDGTVWLNLGDSYASSPPGNLDYAASMAKSSGLAGAKSPRYQATLTAGHATKRNTVAGGLKPKDRAMIPARVALALQADGWWLRDEIVWQKPNPMPSSVKDRTTPAHEMVYTLTRSARYAYDWEAIAEAAVSTREELLRFESRPEIGYPSGKPDRRRNGKRQKVPGGWDIGAGAHGTIHREGRTSATYREATLPGNVSAATERTRVGLNARWDAAEDAGTVGGRRNKRSVWTVATAPYPEAHFATFPPKLIEPMILAGCPEGGIVLDPFAGSGTTGMVAQALSRRAILIDLNADYLVQALARNRDIPLGLTG